MSDDIPDNPREQAIMLETVMTTVCHRSPTPDEERTYSLLRPLLMGDPILKPLLPEFVRVCRTLEQFWPYIKKVSEKEQGGLWAYRRKHVADAFTPLMDYLDGAHTAPVDSVASETLQRFDADGVNALWAKALERRKTDADGAITIARTLLESVFKHVLEDRGIDYEDKEDLPSLYRKVAKALNLAPDQHTEETFKRMLGGCTSIVEGLGSLRSKIGDAHGRGQKGIRPAERHAKLAVNLAGSTAVFVIETHLDKKERDNAGAA